MYPVNLNISGRVCLVVGGGKVALRKVRSLLDAEALVRVVSPVFENEFEKLAESTPDLELCRRGYRSCDVEDTFCVFATTSDSETQELVQRDAKQSGALLNSASDPAACDFQVPAQIKRGDFLLTVSTGGASPAFSRVVRQRLEQEYGDEYGHMSLLMAIVRQRLLDLGNTSQANREVFRALVTADLIGMIKNAQVDDITQLLAEHLPSELDAKSIVKKFLEDVEATVLVAKF